MIRLIPVLALLLGACSTIADTGADRADAFWAASKWQMCYPQTIGAVVRNNPTQVEMDAYMAFCGRTGERPRIIVAE